MWTCQDQLALIRFKEMPCFYTDVQSKHYTPVNRLIGSGSHVFCFIVDFLGGYKKIIQTPALSHVFNHLPYFGQIDKHVMNKRSSREAVRFPNFPVCSAMCHNWSSLSMAQ